MTAERQNLNELLSVLEKIRMQRYPDVPKDLVYNVAVNQYDNQDDRGKARSETLKIVSKYVNELREEDE
jgi:hypothetical protein